MSAPAASGASRIQTETLPSAEFLARVEDQLIPAVERVRAELFRRWPASGDYVRRIDPDSVNRGAGAEA